MRVLFLSHAFPRHEGDPVGSFVLRLAVALRGQGIAVTALVPAARGLAAHDVIEGIPTHRVRYAPRPMETLAYTGTMGQQLHDSWMARAALAGLMASSVGAAIRLVRRERIDLIHAHWWIPGGLVGAMVSAATRRPLITTMHGSDVRLIDQVPLGPRLFRRVASASAAMTTVSSWLAESASRIAPRAKPVVAPMPVIPTLFHAAGAGERLTDRLLFVGKLTEQKGLHYLLEAMAAMTSRPTLDVVGAGRVDDTHLRRMADDLGLGARVNWLPLLGQTELAECYRRATALVIPARDEGLGLTAVEALLSETPVVAFASGGLPDVVLDGETGLLVPTGDVAALATALDRLLSDASLGERLGRAGRVHALQTFGSDAVARTYARLYRAATSPGPA